MCSRKNVFLLSRFNLCKTSVKSSYVSLIADFFLATFEKINTQGFYLDFKAILLLYSIFREDFPVADSVNFKFLITKQSFSCPGLT